MHIKTKLPPLFYLLSNNSDPVYPELLDFLKRPLKDIYQEAGDHLAQACELARKVPLAARTREDRQRLFLLSQGLKLAANPFPQEPEPSETYLPWGMKCVLPDDQPYLLTVNTFDCLEESNIRPFFLLLRVWSLTWSAIMADRVCCKFLRPLLSGNQPELPASVTGNLLASPENAEVIDEDRPIGSLIQFNSLSDKDADHIKTLAENVMKRQPRLEQILSHRLVGWYQSATAVDYQRCEMSLEQVEQMGLIFSSYKPLRETLEFVPVHKLEVKIFWQNGEPQPSLVLDNGQYHEAHSKLILPLQLTAEFLQRNNDEIVRDALSRLLVWAAQWEARDLARHCYDDIDF